MPITGPLCQCGFEALKWRGEKQMRRICKGFAFRLEGCQQQPGNGEEHQKRHDPGQHRQPRTTAKSSFFRATHRCSPALRLPAMNRIKNIAKKLATMTAAMAAAEDRPISYRANVLR